MMPDARRDRWGSAMAAGALQALLLYLFYAGMAVHWTPPAREPVLLAIAPPSPPREERQPPPRSARRPQGQAAPPNRRAHATEIAAPVPIIPPIVPPVIAVAPIAGSGLEALSGAADMPGPGTGAGGIGAGTGAGGRGDGDGGGRRGNIPPRRVSGRIKNSDYPAAAGAAGIGGTVTVLYTVEANGRVSDCRATVSSGNAELDETTCRLVQRRFRFQPSRDAAGRPVRAMIVENHSWISLPPERMQDR